VPCPTESIRIAIQGFHKYTIPMEIRFRPELMQALAHCI
jgi:hypothetical protein